MYLWIYFMRLYNSFVTYSPATYSSARRLCAEIAAVEMWKSLQRKKTLWFPHEIALKNPTKTMG